MLPGWQCASCHAFNGEAKEILTTCRACGADRIPTLLDCARAVLAAWKADGAGHALRCSPAMVGAMLDLEEAVQCS